MTYRRPASRGGGGIDRGGAPNLLSRPCSFRTRTRLYVSRPICGDMWGSVLSRLKGRGRGWVPIPYDSSSVGRHGLTGTFGAL